MLATEGIDELTCPDELVPPNLYPAFRGPWFREYIMIGYPILIIGHDAFVLMVSNEKNLQ